VFQILGFCHTHYTIRAECFQPPHQVQDFAQHRRLLIVELKLLHTEAYPLCNSFPAHCCLGLGQYARMSLQPRYPLALGTPPGSNPLLAHSENTSAFDNPRSLTDVNVSVFLSKKVYMCMCPIPNGFRDRAISLYSSKIVDKRYYVTVSNTGIYCSSDKVGTVYLV
jgi:hypothetical protein